MGSFQTIHNTLCIVGHTETHSAFMSITYSLDGIKEVTVLLKEDIRILLEPSSLPVLEISSNGISCAFNYTN